MGKNISILVTVVLIAVILTACTSQNKVHHLIPDDDYFNTKPDKVIAIEDITETMNGDGAANLPDWIFVYFTGGIAEVEKNELYRDKYLFIAENEGVNFSALSKWADNYSVVQDFPRLAAVRIEKRLVSEALLYPDDEYGSFYEIFVKKTFDAKYNDAVKEDTYWIKVKNSQEYNIEQDETIEPSEIYEFFVFISIDKVTMQTVIGDMMAEVIAEVTPTRAQSASISRLQQTFFEVF